VGLGAAANAIAVLEAFHNFRGDAAIELHSFDRSIAALEFGLQHAAELEYLDPYSGTLRELLARGITRVGPVSWVVHIADFSGIRRRDNPPSPYAILYDPYSPRANPDMWTLG